MYKILYVSKIPNVVINFRPWGIPDDLPIDNTSITNVQGNNWKPKTVRLTLSIDSMTDLDEGNNMFRTVVVRRKNDRIRAKTE